MSICRQLLAIGLAASLALGMTGLGMTGLGMTGLGPGPASAQTPVPSTPKEAPAVPKDVPSGTTVAPATPAQAPALPKDAPSGTTAAPATPKESPALPKDAPRDATPAPATPEPKPKPQAPTPSTPTPGTSGAPARQLAPPGTPQTQEFEPNASPTTPRVATSETVEVPARPVVMVKGAASFDDAFKAIKAALDKAKAAMAKAGLTQIGHELAIITSTDDKGLEFEAALPIAEKPAGKDGSGKDGFGKDGFGKIDLGDGVTVGTSPAGPALKFRHLGPYDDIDRTYATITSYLDNKGLSAKSPFIEEYPDGLPRDDDPKLAVDIYIFIEK